MAKQQVINKLVKEVLTSSIGRSGWWRREKEAAFTWKDWANNQIAWLDVHIEWSQDHSCLWAYLGDNTRHIADYFVQLSAFRQLYPELISTQTEANLIDQFGQGNWEVTSEITDLTIKGDVEEAMKLIFKKLHY